MKRDMMDDVNLNLPKGGIFKGFSLESVDGTSIKQKVKTRRTFNKNGSITGFGRDSIDGKYKRV